MRRTWPRALLHTRRASCWPPRPEADGGIDEARHAEAVDQVADEPRPADHGTRGDRRAGVREGELEEPERQEGDAGRPIRGGHALEEEVLRADEWRPRPEHE